MLIRTSKDKDHPYVMLNKSFLEDPNLSLKAKGLLAYCMCKPDGWQFHVEQLTSVLKEGKHSIYATFKELITHNYCKRWMVRDKTGQVIKSEYTLFEVPDIEQPDDKKDQFPENQKTDNPFTEKQPLVINDNRVINDCSDICAEKIDAPKKKLKNKINDKPKRRELVQTSDEEHEKLVKKYGQILTEQCYDHLHEWKLSKAESDPRAVDKHTDYYRIIKWVAKAIKEEESKKNTPEKDWKKINANYVYQSKKDSGDVLKHIIFDGDFIKNSKKFTELSLKMQPSAFEATFPAFAGVKMARFTDEKDGKDGIQIHADYKINLEWAGKFIRNYNDVFSGTPMQIYIRNCLDNEHFYVLMEYTLRIPDQEIGKTVWANPITLNQGHEDFLKEFKHNYMRYKVVARKYAGSKEMNEFFEAIPNKKGREY